ncbi:MAG: Uma2 family endonuclease, partial [Leptolyngbyaceae cyanobacterium SM2_3_12]|nr:Uma2 family endonuclease [Leptolyngbyaceae cyanobacterium SM2_3_12]
MKYLTNINDLDLNGTYTYADYLTWRFEQSVELIKGKIFPMTPAP